MVDLERWSIYGGRIIWDPNKAIDVGEWSICGGGQLERFYCIYIYVCKKKKKYIYRLIYVSSKMPYHRLVVFYLYRYVYEYSSNINKYMLQELKVLCHGSR